MTFYNPFPIKGVNTSDTLEALGGVDIDNTRADYKYRQMVGDVPVAFADVLTGKEEDTLGPSATVAEHVGFADKKILQFLGEQDSRELVDAGYYIGVCLVGVTVSSPFRVRKIVDKEFVRLAIFKPTQYRIV